MRTSRTIAFALLVVVCAVFVFCYLRVVSETWAMREDQGIYLFTEQRVCVWKAWTHAHGERDGWAMFLELDPPEGTRAIFNFPTWPLVLAAAGVSVYATFRLIGVGENLSA